MGFGFKPCWSCGSDGECFAGCACAKCVDPEGYAEWKRNNPGKYKNWVRRQAEDYDPEFDEDEDY